MGYNFIMSGKGLILILKGSTIGDFRMAALRFIWVGCDTNESQVSDAQVLAKVPLIHTLSPSSSSLCVSLYLFLCAFTCACSCQGWILCALQGEVRVQWRALALRDFPPFVRGKVSHWSGTLLVSELQGSTHPHLPSFHHWDYKSLLLCLAWVQGSN